jgi:hypothetical protein
MDKNGMDKTMKMALTMLATVFLGCSVLCEQAQAVQITGDIGFFGPATASGASPGTPDVTITFTNPWHVLSVTSGSTYELNGVPVFPAVTPATFTNFSFSGDGTSAALAAQNLPEWTFSFGGIDYSFDLLSLTNGHTQLAQGLGAMAFSGTGTVHATGFDDTPASWSLQGTGAGLIFTLSSSTTSSVPEAGVTTLLLVGFGVFAGDSLRRKLRAI